MEFNIGDTAVDTSTGYNCEIIAKVRDCCVVELSKTGRLELVPQSFLMSKSAYDEALIVKSKIRSVSDMIENQFMTSGIFNMSPDEANKIHSIVEKACGKDE